VDLDQFLFDVTDIAIVILVMFAWSMFVVGLYSTIRWIVIAVLGRFFGRH